MSSDNLPIIVIAVILILVILLLIGYYLLFIRKKGIPAWKNNLYEKYRLVNAKELEPRMLLIELDKLLEYGLKERFSSKDSLGKILKAKDKKFTKSELNSIWTAHKLRNKIVHDVDAKFTPSELNFALISLKRAIKNQIED